MKSETVLKMQNVSVQFYIVHFNKHQQNNRYKIL